MSWTKDNGAPTMQCDGCRAPVHPDSNERVTIKHGNASVKEPWKHYHSLCWQTGWYTGIEPKGEWPVEEPTFDHIGKQVLAPEDPVNSPSHYRQLPNGIEVIDVTENFDFLIGNVLKYVLRAEYKGKPLEDWKKARWYLDRAIEKRERDNGNSETVV